jgi:hypothetical protein
VDTALTTQSFREVDIAVSPDYRKVGRPFVMTRRDDAIRCNPVAKLQCFVSDGGLYTAISSVKPDDTSGRYTIKLLIYWTGSGGMIHGLEQEMVVGIQPLVGWRVERLGRVVAIN